MIDLLLFMCIVLSCAVVTLCMLFRSMRDKVDTLQVEVNYFIKEISTLEDRVDNMNKETLRILSEKVAELEDRP